MKTNWLKLNVLLVTDFFIAYEFFSAGPAGVDLSFSLKAVLGLYLLVHVWVLVKVLKGQR